MCESFLEVNQWYHEEHLAFSMEKHLIMLRDAVTQMQNNNRSQMKQAGNSKLGDDANWGGHGLGEVTHFMEPEVDMCPIPEEEMRRNELLGNWTQAASTVTILHGTGCKTESGSAPFHSGGEAAEYASTESDDPAKLSERFKDDDNDDNQPLLNLVRRIPTNVH